MGPRSVTAVTLGRGKRLPPDLGRVALVASRRGDSGLAAAGYLVLFSQGRCRGRKEIVAETYRDEGEARMGRDLRVNAEGLPALTALLYDDGPAFGLLSRRIAGLVQAAGLACAGFVQHDEERPDRGRCDMVIENLASGARIQISEDRGAEARGCRLDPQALVAAVETSRLSLSRDVQVLLLSKFGKSEAEGSGFRPLIAQALELGVPVIVGVPRRNIENWRRFAEDLAHEIDAEALAPGSDADVLATLGL